MITIEQIINNSSGKNKVWIESHRNELLPALKSLNNLNWPAIIHSTAFKCDRSLTPTIAAILGYRMKPCPSTPDGIWRNKNGSLKAFFPYERTKHV